MPFGGLGRGKELSGSLVNLQQQAVWHSVWGGGGVEGDQWDFEGLRTLVSEQSITSLLMNKKDICTRYKPIFLLLKEKKAARASSLPHKPLEFEMQTILVFSHEEQSTGRTTRLSKSTSSLKEPLEEKEGFLTQQ